MASLFYPSHYLLTRPYARELHAKLTLQTPQRLTPRDAEKAAADALLPYLSSKGWSIDNVVVLSQEMQGALAWLDWDLNGRIITAVGKDLTLAFERSDCGDMRIDDVMPSGSISRYIYFEGPLNSPILIGSEKAVFEGAYVIGNALDSLRIVLCGRSPEGTSIYNQWRERYDLRIPSKYYGITADEAIDYALADDLKDLENAQIALRSKSASTAVLMDAQALATRMRQDYPAYREALRLVMNALAYSRAYPDDKRLEWNEGAPSRRVVATRTGSPTARTRALSKLWSLGHLEVQWLGTAFVATKDSTERDAAGVRVHWRRGHWRHQAHGPALSLRKLMWIQPMLVGSA